MPKIFALRNSLLEVQQSLDCGLDKERQQSQSSTLLLEHHFGSSCQDDTLVLERPTVVRKEQEEEEVQEVGGVPLAEVQVEEEEEVEPEDSSLPMTCEEELPETKGRIRVLYAYLV